MGTTDSWGVLISTTSSEASELYTTALVDYCRLANNPAASLDAALVADPTWVLALAFRSYLDIFSQRQHGIDEALARLAAHADAIEAAPERERLHAQAAVAWAKDDLEGALRKLCEAIGRNPRDLLAIRISHDLAFLLGDGRSLRDVVARSIYAWSPSDDTFGLLQGMYAFGLEETGEYERAERAALRALEIDEGDVWAVHAMAHVLEMQGRQKEGEAFLESSASHWRDSFFAVHNWWHLALYYIELDKLDGALDLYDGPIREHCSGEWLDLVDAASLLWRLSLLGVDTGDRAQEVVSVLEGRIGEAMYPFNDLHSVMAFCLAQKPALADKLITERKAVARGSAAFTLERAGLDLLKGIAQFARGDYRSAENYLLKARPNATVMGGSNAQRDIVDQTLLVACARGGDINANLALSSERRERQHWSDSSIERLGGILA